MENKVFLRDIIGDKAFSIKKNTNDKKIDVIFHVAPSGDGQDGVRFANALQNLASTIDANEYNLVIDCLKFGIFTPAYIPILEQCFKLYKACNFKNVVTIVNQAVLSIQLKRIGKETGLNLTVDLRK